MALVRYTFKHQWLSLEDHILTVGITDHGCAEVGDIVSVDLPAVGSTVCAGSNCITLKSRKVDGHVQAPLSGEVIEVNAEVRNRPALLKQDPEGEGWMVRIRLPNRDGFDNYLMPWEYRRFATTGL